MAEITTKSRTTTSPSGRGGRRRTQAERTAESTARLLDAAASLFATHGYDRATFAQIAERAGYSSGLVAQRFGTKAALVEALVRDTRLRTWKEVLGPALDHKSPSARAVGLIRVYTDSLTKGGDRLRALFVLMSEAVGPLGSQREIFAEQNRAFMKMFEMQITAGQAQGEIDPSINAREMALEIVSMLRGITLMWLVDPENIDIHAISEKIRRDFAAKLRAGTEEREGERK